MKTRPHRLRTTMRWIVSALCLMPAVCALADDDKLRDLGTNAAPGEIPKWDGSQWRNAHDDITTVIAGQGIVTTGTNKTVTISVDFGTPKTNATVASYQEMDATRPPVGAIVAWASGISGVPTNLPSGWIRCDGQVLSDTNSPLNGRTMPNLNGLSAEPKRFLRGSNVSGQTGGGAHNHRWYQIVDGDSAYALPLSTANKRYGSFDVNGGADDFAPNQYGWQSGIFYTSQDDAPPSFYEVVWIMRIK